MIIPIYPGVDVNELDREAALNGIPRTCRGITAVLVWKTTRIGLVDMTEDGVVIVQSVETVINYYLGDDADTPHRLNDPCRAEYPKLYKTAGGLQKTLARLNEEYAANTVTDEEAGVETVMYWIPAYWTHPDAHFRPSEKHLRTRNRFPGCPTQ
jgi:hypothetical protein